MIDANQDQLVKELRRAHDAKDFETANSIATQIKQLKSSTAIAENTSPSMSEDEALVKLREAHTAGDTSKAAELAKTIKTLRENPVAATTDVETPVSPEPEKPSFFWQQVKAGATDFLFDVAPEGVLRAIYEIPELDDPSDISTWNMGYRLQQRLEPFKRDFYNFNPEAQAETKLEQYIGQGIRGVASEGPLVAVGARTLAGVGVEALASFIASTTGAVTYDAAKETALSLGASETTAENTAQVLATVAGAGTQLSRAVVGSAAQRGSSSIKEAWKTRKRVTETADAAAEYVAAKEVEAVIKNATKAQPDIDAVIKATTELQENFSGLVIPPAAILADNPIYRKNTSYLLKTDPNFYADVKKSLSDAVGVITARKEKLFGVSGAAADAKIRQALPENYTVNIRNAKKRVNLLDDAIHAEVSKMRTAADVVDIGTRVDNMMSAKVAAVRAQLSPQYEKVINRGIDEGIKLPNTSVKRVYDTVKLLKAEDVFASFPSLARAVDAQWRPTVVKKQSAGMGSLLTGRPGRAITDVERHSAVSLRELDSLKRNLNAAVRKTTDPAQKRKLVEVQKVLREEINKLPESFSKAYTDLDTAFYKELGIPFSSAELAQLNSTRFKSRAGAYLTNPQHAGEFLNFVGPDGIPVVRDAVYMKMQEAVFTKDGDLDARNLAKFMRKNKRLIDTVPGLRDDLKNANTIINKLTNTKTKLDAQYNARSSQLADGFFQGMAKKSLSAVVNDIRRSPEVNAKYLRDVKNFEPETAAMVRQGVRSELVQQAFDANINAVEFIKENRQVFEGWFSPQYLKDVEALSQVSDIIKKVEIDKLKFAIDYRASDSLESAIGVSSTQLQSVLRDRITNFGTKLAILGSKMNTASASVKRDNALRQLLLEPDSLSTIRKNAEAYRLSNVTSADIPGFLKKTSKDVGGSLVFAAAKGGLFGLSGAEQAQKEDNAQ